MVDKTGRIVLSQRHVECGLTFGTHLSPPLTVPRSQSRCLSWSWRAISAQSCWHRTWCRAGLSGQHSRGGDASTGLWRRCQCSEWSSSPGWAPFRQRLEGPVTARTKPFSCLLVTAWALPGSTNRTAHARARLRQLGGLEVISGSQRS